MSSAEETPWTAKYRIGDPVEVRPEDPTVPWYEGRVVGLSNTMVVVLRNGHDESHAMRDPADVRARPPIPGPEHEDTIVAAASAVYFVLLGAVTEAGNPYVRPAILSRALAEFAEAAEHAQGGNDAEQWIAILAAEAVELLPALRAARKDG